jgi:hypothetical protein
LREAAASYHRTDVVTKEELRGAEARSVQPWRRADAGEERPLVG